MILLVGAGERIALTGTTNLVTNGCGSLRRSGTTDGESTITPGGIAPDITLDDALITQAIEAELAK